MAETATTTSEHKGDYGYDGSFRTVSAGTQMAAVGVGSAALLAVAGVRNPRMAHVVRRPLVLHAVGHRDETSVSWALEKPSVLLKIV